MTQAEPHQHQEEGSRTAGKPTSHIRQNSPDTMSYNYPQNNDSIYSLGESVRSQHTVNQSLLSLRQSCADTIGEAEVLPSLTGINIEVKSSRLELDKRGNQVIIFLIDVFEIKEPAGSVTSTDAQTELGKRKIWVLKKLYSDFLTLDNEIRRWSGDTIDVQSLPDTPALRKAHSKDFRKKLLEDYLKWAIRSAAECESLKKFLSTNIVDEAKTMYYKEGFLFKTGRNLGGLKRRYYVTNPAEKTLEYYDKPGGSRVGVIPLEGAVVKTER
ncbi:Rho GTPase activating protein, partial [Spiromyces aspiralis]